MTSISRSVIIATALLGLLNSGLSQAFPRYKITPIIPASPMVTTASKGIAPNAGHVSGFGIDAGYTPQGFHWQTPGPLQVIPPIGSDQASRATAVNDLGEVVGWSGATDSSTGTAFVWDGTSPIALPLLPGYSSSRANGINNAGRIVGFSHLDFPTRDQAMIWDGGVASQVGSGLTEIGRTLINAWGVNQAGQVVGGTNDPSNAAASHAFFWDGAALSAIDLPEPEGAITTDAWAVNDHGEAVGNAFINTGGWVALFWDKDHEFSEIPPPLGSDTPIPRDINNASWVVGTSGNGPWVWNANEGSASLQDLLVGPNTNDWDLRTPQSGAFGIDNCGRIAGEGSYRGTDTAFVLTPVSAQRCIKDLPPGNAVGWVVGGKDGSGLDDYGVILHTQDGGATWERQGAKGETPDAFYSSVSAVDAYNAWVVGNVADGYGVILRTWDGGQTWTRQSSIEQIPDAGLTTVYGLNKRIAWTVGGDVILHTKDGGKTWVRQGLKTGQDVDLMGVYASDASHVWAVGDVKSCPPPDECGVIFHSRNGGRTWERQSFPSTGEQQESGLITLHGLDPRNLWAVGSNTVLNTNDGGRIWQNITEEAGNFPWDINGVFAVDRNTVWIATDYDALFKYDGTQWVQQISSSTSPLPGYYLLRLSAVDARNVWVVGTVNPVGGGDLPHGVIFHSKTGGDEWVRQDPGVDAEFWNVSFVKSPPQSPPKPLPRRLHPSPHQKPVRE